MNNNALRSNYAMQRSSRVVTPLAGLAERRTLLAGQAARRLRAAADRGRWASL
jgi:hypothetical protein